MQVSYIVAIWHLGVMVMLLGLVACFVNLKDDGSNPLLGYTSTMNVFSLHPAVAWYFARLFITKRWLAFIRWTLKIQNVKFSLFDVFRWTLNVPGENPVWLLWVSSSSLTSDFCFHGLNSAVQTVITACNSPITSTVTPLFIIKCASQYHICVLFNNSYPCCS